SSWISRRPIYCLTEKARNGSGKKRLPPTNNRPLRSLKRTASGSTTIHLNKATTQLNLVVMFSPKKRVSPAVNSKRFTGLAALSRGNESWPENSHMKKSSFCFLMIVVVANSYSLSGARGQDTAARLGQPNAFLSLDGAITVGTSPLLSRLK